MRRPTPDEEGALGTGLLLTTIVVGLGTAAVAATSGDLAGWLLGDGGKSDLILLAAISGDRGHLAAGEQRGQDGAAAGNLRHSPCRPTPRWRSRLAIPLVVADGGVTAVLIGFAIGNAAALLTALVANREATSSASTAGWSPGFFVGALYLVPIIGGFWVVQNVDTLLLTRFVSAADIGFYRVAGRVASGCASPRPS